jgi:pentatricopeptide repeat protein
MRRKPTSQNNGGYNNQHRKPRYQQGGGSHSGGNHGQHGRPRKNYSAMREKYLNQARDALSMGDRVLAENWFQHADHCYRMMMEEGFQPNRPQQQQNPQQQGAQPQDGEGNVIQEDTSSAADTGTENVSHLPSFITSGFPAADGDKTPPPAQNWEDRDAN